jgi:hypothetical protein
MQISKAEKQGAAMIAGYIFCLGMLVGYVAHMQLEKKDRASYDVQHITAIDFMAHNPKVREEMCSKRMKHVDLTPMDGRVK